MWDAGSSAKSAAAGAGTSVWDAGASAKSAADANASSALVAWPSKAVSACWLGPGWMGGWASTGDVGAKSSAGDVGSRSSSARSSHWAGDGSAWGGWPPWGSGSGWECCSPSIGGFSAFLAPLPLPLPLPLACFEANFPATSLPLPLPLPFPFPAPFPLPLPLPFFWAPNKIWPSMATFCFCLLTFSFSPLMSGSFLFSVSSSTRSKRSWYSDNLSSSSSSSAILPLALDKANACWISSSAFKNCSTTALYTWALFGWPGKYTLQAARTSLASLTVNSKPLLTLARPRGIPGPVFSKHKEPCSLSKTGCAGISTHSSKVTMWWNWSAVSLGIHL